MTKIINGAKYSTETARCIAGWENGSNQSDFNYCSEDLYRTKSGKYFLFCAGGALSRYASHSGNNSGWGERILPMTEGQAKAWAEEYVDGETYELCFGAVSEDDDLLPLSVQIPADVREKLDALKAATGLNLSVLVAAAINSYAEKTTL